MEKPGMSKEELKARLEEFTAKNTFGGSEMRAIRLSHELTLEEFVFVVGFANIAYCSDMEKGKKEVSPRMQIALRNLLAMKTNGGRRKA